MGRRVTEHNEVAHTSPAGGPLRVCFDVDDTLLTWNKRLRPFAREVIEAVSLAGAEVYLWSGVGVRWEVAYTYDLRAHIRDCFMKPLSRHHERLSELGIPFVPDHVVDDDDEIVRVFGGTHVPAPLEPLDQDRALLQVLTDLADRFASRLSSPSALAIE